MLNLDFWRRCCHFAELTLLNVSYSSCLYGFSKVPAYLNVVDIAGLVKGAHEGKGLGNAFLSNINACDAMFHVVRKSVQFVSHITSKQMFFLQNI